MMSPVIRGSSSTGAERYPKTATFLPAGPSALDTDWPARGYLSASPQICASWAGVSNIQTCIAMLGSPRP